MRTQAKRGFTLIELLVVIAIIGLLSTLAVVAMSNARLKARDAKRVSDIKQIQSALDLFATDKNGYVKKGTAAAPQTLGAAGALCLSDVEGLADACTGNVYMAKVPSNPTPGGRAAGYGYYGDGDCTGAVCTNYTILFDLEADTGELKDTASDADKIPNCKATAGGITCT